ncbi:hypothetical protein JAAARDRAFT_692970, partial [Jaapia argillacea MUCL 33604]
SSLLFVGTTVGFCLGTLVVESVVHFLGRFYTSAERASCIPAVPMVSRLLSLKSVKTESRDGVVGYSPSQARLLSLFIFSLVHASFFIIMGLSKGFPGLFMAYVTAAFARAFLTGENAYIASTPTKGLGYTFGFWSAGGFVAPLVCQTLIAQGIPWSHFYLGSLVISAINSCLFVYAFRSTSNEFTRDRQAALHASFPQAIPETKADHTDYDYKEKSSSCLKRAFSMVYVWAFSIYLWIYSGSENTTVGFMTTYVLDVRHANPNTAGYVVSGFWGGQVISRFAWGYASPRLSFTTRKYILHGCLFIAFAMNILIWFINSTVENALSTSIIGLVYGPIFPGTLGLSNDILPEDVHMISMAIMSAFSSFGAAIFPFITGLLATKKGAQTLTYMTVAQTVALATIWFLFPSRIPRRLQTSRRLDVRVPSWT